MCLYLYVCDAIPINLVRFTGDFDDKDLDVASKDGYNPDPSKGGAGGDKGPRRGAHSSL